ncbi:DUF305 domain-containing protein [Cupriavidus campinensis]|uniref:DUF305 domain-containing protein n=1 Tax=Cupriavidus campinensis TaxID=151783 RepID=UPI0011EF6335
MWPRVRPPPFARSPVPSHPRSPRPTLRFLLPLLAALALPAVAAPPAGPDSAAFLAESDAAMTKMMDDMAVKPSGNVDEDFVAMMIPHHQGAIDMAMAELRHGKNEQLRRIAQEIIVDQLQEIAAMRLALGQPLPPSTPAPTRPDPVQPTTQPATQPTPPSHSAHAH